MVCANAYIDRSPPVPTKKTPHTQDEKAVAQSSEKIIIRRLENPEKHDAPSAPPGPRPPEDKNIAKTKSRPSQQKYSFRMRAHEKDRRR